MKLRHLLFALGGLVCANSWAQTGNEWQSPELLSLNKLQPQPYVFHFASQSDARRVLPEASTYHQSLDGTWKFHWVATPEERDSTFHRLGFDASGWDDIEVPGCWNVQGLQKDGTMKYGVPIYVNQPVIFYHEVKVDDWRKGVMRTPPAEWTTYKYRNEVGSYLRTFTIPAAWKGRRVNINFDGVDSFFYLWINGQYVGFSKNSRNTASFDITPYLAKQGENIVAVEVYRSSDGSFLESQDMFRLPGIYRSAYLTSQPLVQLSDLVVRTASIKNSQAVIDVQANVQNLGTKQPKGMSVRYRVYPVELYGDATSSTPVAESKVAVGAAVNTQITLSNPLLWSAEAPNRYVLVAEILDKKEQLVDCISTYFGVRTVEIRETAAADDEFGLAGRYFYVNDKPVKLKGVNRHETSLDRGHAITHEQMQEEIMIMKRGNINHIRLSHYSNDPYLYYLADKYGLYLEDECNIESHQYYYGAASLSHPQEWKAAHVSRVLEMAHAHVNHPSIVIWSLGNEAGPGDNFVAAYDALKAFDASRPVQYERNNNIVDMGSNQYPSVDWVRTVVKGQADVKYPYHISEYAHSMGNSLGNLVDYWEAMESTNFFCGAAIWDWVDQAIDTYTPNGTKYMGYGGDHGDWPNDGMFCMNGILLPDFSPKPQYFEVKKVYQNVGVKADFDHNAVEVFNKNYFQTLADYNLGWRLLKDGVEVKRGDFAAALASHGPRETKRYALPFKVGELPADGEYFLTVEFTLGKDMPWAKQGYVQMDEQLLVHSNFERTLLDGKQGGLTTYQARPTVKAEQETVLVEGRGFSAVFSNKNGQLTALTYGGQPMIVPGYGPQLDAFRAPVDNDNWARDQWFQQGLYNLQHTALGAPVVQEQPDGSITIDYTVRSQAPRMGRGIHRPGKAGQPFEKIEEEQEEPALSFTTTQRYTIHTDGSISLAASIISSESAIALPRLGYVMKLPKTLDQYTYYGRGPLNNYADRKTGSFFGLYKSTVQEQFVNFPKPQSMGNREEVRWCALTDKSGRGLQFVADRQPVSTSALPWSALQMTLSAHPHELPQSDATYLHLDCQVTGLGGNSCGQGGPLDPDRVQGSLHQMHFIIRPVSGQTNLTQNAKVKDDTRCPVSISRDRAGNITINADQTLAKPAVLCYQITKPGQKVEGRKQKAANPVLKAEGGSCVIPLREGGIVSAWYEDEPAVKITATYDAVEIVPVEVAYVSSEEGPYGEVAKNLVDGDPTTIWHTMYSITVPKFPHWIDFDCNELKNIKGFTYLPRQDGSSTGDIRQYKVEVSEDNQAWKLAAEGEFKRDKKEKRVMFGQPIRGRYLRFTALSAQDGRDYGSGAEFTVIAE